MKQPCDFNKNLSWTYLREIIEYEENTGLFRWKTKRRYGVDAGRVAGTKMLNGYQSIAIDGEPYLAHRLAWFYVTGAWPSCCIDHINGDPSDNRLTNLREATVSQNHFNTKRPANNTSGRKGVWFDKRRGRWSADIMIDGRKVFLGSSKIFEDACSIRQNGELKFFGEFARAL